MGFGQRAAEHGEILAEDIDHAAIDRAPAGDDAIAGDLGAVHAEIGAAVGDEHVVFLERAFVEQDVEALARGQLALGMLRVDARLPAAHARFLAAAFQFFQNFVHARPLVCRLH